MDEFIVLFEKELSKLEPTIIKIASINVNENRELKWFQKTIISYYENAELRLEIDKKGGYPLVEDNEKASLLVIEQASSIFEILVGLIMGEKNLKDYKPNDAYIKVIQRVMRIIESRYMGKAPNEIEINNISREVIGSLDKKDMVALFLDRSAIYSNPNSNNIVYNLVTSNAMYDVNKDSLYRKVLIDNTRGLIKSYDECYSSPLNKISDFCSMYKPVVGLYKRGVIEDKGNQKRQEGLN